MKAFVSSLGPDLAVAILAMEDLVSRQLVLAMGPVLASELGSNKVLATVTLATEQQVSCSAPDTALVVLATEDLV
ncbi:hypothetical protein MTO96_017505 [Rhipicephalus appendiculatus]